MSRRTFAGPDPDALRFALRALIELQTGLRSQVDARVGPRWTTSGEALLRITELVRAL